MKILLALTFILLASPLFAHDTNWGGHSFRGGYQSRYGNGYRNYPNQNFRRGVDWNNYRAPYRPNWGGYRPYYRPYPTPYNGFYFRFSF